MTTNYNNQSEEENFLFGKDKKNPFAVPQGYFESLSAKVLNKIEVEEELKQYAVLSALTPPQPSLLRQMLRINSERGPFIVPENYFIKNENLLEYRYELATFNALASIPKPVLKPLSEEYLDSLSAKILKQIEVADELKEYSMLSELQKEKVFVVAPDYFETIADKVKERYHSSKREKISVVEQVLSLLFKPKMAFAYSMVLIVGIGMFFFFNKPNTVTIPAETGDCKTLACLERKELLNDHTIQNLDEENLYDLVDADQLDKQLSDTKDSVATNIDSVPKK